MSSAPRVSVSIAPHLTTLAMISDTLAYRHRGLPTSWRRTLASQVRPHGHEAARALITPGQSLVPDVIAPCPPIGDVPMAAQIEALYDVSPDALVKDLERTFGPGRLPERWRTVADRPARWLHGYAQAVTDVWKTTEPLWRRARALLDSEIHRVGVASVRGGSELLLGSLSHRIRYGERGLLIAGIEPSTYELGAYEPSTYEPSAYELGDRSIVLVPMLAGADAVFVNLDSPDAVWIAYPLPGAQSLWHRPPAPALDELSALVGPVRAQLLFALDEPQSMGALAGITRITPSSLTYHRDLLSAARLITRERRGREVWIARTSQAEELLDLFSR